MGVTLRMLTCRAEIYRHHQPNFTRLELYLYSEATLPQSSSLGAYLVLCQALFPLARMLRICPGSKALIQAKNVIMLILTL